MAEGLPPTLAPPTRAYWPHAQTVEKEPIAMCPCGSLKQNQLDITVWFLTSLAFFFFLTNFNFLYLSNCTLCCLLTGDNQRDSNSPIWSLGQQPWGQTPFHRPQTLQFAPHLWALFLLWHGDMLEESFHNLRQWVSGLHLGTLFLSKFTWRRLQHRFSLWLSLTYFWE